MAAAAAAAAGRAAGLQARRPDVPTPARGIVVGAVPGCVGAAAFIACGPARGALSSVAGLVRARPAAAGAVGSKRRGPRRVPTSALPAALSVAIESRDIAATVFAAVGSLVWVRIFDELAQRNILEQKLSRKLVHITTGPLFMLTWPFFSSSPAAPLLAAAVPMLNGLKLIAIGTGLIKDEKAVRSISREGDPRELLRGPLFYVLTMSAATAVFWRGSPVGLAALALMCGGDGLADVVGRRLGAGNRLPFNPAKSWAGTAAMVVGGAGLLYAFLALFHACGYVAMDPSAHGPAILLVALVAAAVEALPLAGTGLDDNLTVPLAAMAAAWWLLPH